MRWLRLAPVILLSTACRTTTYDRYEYQLAGSGPKIPPAIQLSARYVADGIELELTNTSTTTVRVLWDRSAIVNPNGTSDAILLQDQKIVEANKPARRSSLRTLKAASFWFPPTT